VRRIILATAASLAAASGLGFCVAAMGQTTDELSDLDELLSPNENPAPPPKTSPDTDAAPAPTEAPASPGDAPPQDAPASSSPQPEASAETLETIPVVSRQQVPPTPDTAPGVRPGIEEIVVSARRVAENMQDVPVAISAMSADDLTREQINSPQDLQGKVPSLVISTNSQMRSTETPAIRGQGAQFGAAPGVIIYFAEVPLPSDLVANNQGGPGKFFDLQNLQILKGSQGTLFGRNTTGGALLLEPHRPEEGYSASLRGEANSLSGTGYEAVFNAPVVEQALLARVGFKYFDREGFTHDVATGKDYDSKHYWTSRLGLSWRPSDRIENYLLAYYTRNRDNGTGNVIEDINKEGLNRGIQGAIGLGIIPPYPDPLGVGPGCLLLNLFGPSTNCGQDILDEQRARGDRRVQLSADPNDILDTSGVVDNFSYDLVEDLTLRNIASYSWFKHHYRWDLDGSRAQFIDYFNSDDQFQADLSTLTEELQLQGKALDGLLNYVVGGYYEYTDATGVADATALFVERITQLYTQEKTSYAPFFQGTYDLGGLHESLSGLNLTAGARYTFDKTTGYARLTQVAGGVFTTVDNPHNASLKDAALTYTVGLDYKFDAHLLYGKISRGYKTGGISVISVNPDHFTYDSEFVLNYEIGHKSDFEIAEMPVRLNSAIYFTDYDNLQKASIDTYLDPDNPSLLPQVGAATINAGKAQLAGLEIEAILQPFAGATLAATYGYTYAEYKEFNLVVAGATPTLDCSGEEVPIGEVSELSCVPFQQTPKNNFSVSGRYLLPIDARWGEVEGSLTYAWNDRQYTSTNTVPEAEPGAWLDSQGLFNGSLRWTRIFGSAFDAQLYGTNLTDETYRISNSNQWTFTYMRSSIYSEPRIIGLQLGYRWE
jgi:iron complex outermembrane receptor protein